MKERVIGLPVPPPGMTWEQWKGSPEWAVRLRAELRVHAEGEVFKQDTVRSYLEEVREWKAWTLLTSADGKPFRSFREMCEHPKPEGLGLPFARLEPLWKRAADVRPARDRGRPSREETVLGNTDSSYQSQSADGLLSRIARDAPGVLEAVKAGEFPSARSAAKAAGIPVSDPSKRTVYLPQDAQAAADKLADKFGATWCESLLPCLTKSIRARRDVQ